ncbi:helix-turn-helix transcriptional regulator [Brevibacillus migulae]|uniref:helix-turn-helix transcriptional regulator n=1 Tax=Brevibacillus migulae TaxID=1644114 RepID=UPI00106E29B2|nr:YafY family protein [Brevibacillus migulae]
MSKADNMLSILWLLKTKKKITAKQLAETLEINIRTVYRYIDALCASGVPIISDAGHNGGYSLLHEFTEAPLFFDMEEQKALTHAAKFAKEAGYPHGEALDRAIAKLRKYTSQEQQNMINRHIVGFDVIHPPTDTALEQKLQELEMAVGNERTLTMAYHKGMATAPQTRQIDPYGLVYWKNNWYLVAYCHLRGEIRSFRADRIRTLSATDGTFTRPEGFSARHFFLSRLLPDLDNREQLIPVTIHAKEAALNDLCDHWLFGHGLIERSEQRAQFLLQKESVLYYVPYILVGYGKSIKKVEPQMLKEKMVELTAELYAYYSAETELH